MLKKYYSEKLTGRAYDAYYTLESAVRGYQSECMLYGVTPTEAQEVFNAVLLDNPDLYYFAGQTRDLRQESQGVRARLYYHSCDEGKFSDEWRKIIDELDSKITSYTTDYEVAKLVYEYLTKNVEGETNLYCDYLRINPNDRRAQETFMQKNGTLFSAYGAIVEKKAVCMGMVLAYKSLMDYYRVETTCAVGSANGPHIVNVVEIEGSRAYVDLTKGLKDKELPMIRYDVFLMGEQQVKKYFTAEENFGCDRNDLHYFAKNKLYFKDGHSLRRYLNSCTYQKTNGEIRFYYGGKGFKDKDLGKLTGEIISQRCGTEYDFGGYIVEFGIGNCMIKKHED